MAAARVWRTVGLVTSVGVGPHRIRRHAPVPQRSEAQVLHDVREALRFERDVVLWRNNVGVAAHRDRPVKYGLCEGSSDLIGILETRAVIVDQSGGSAPITLARFIAIEVKAPPWVEPPSAAHPNGKRHPGGRATREQLQFFALVRRRGGFAAIVDSADSARAAIARARTGASE